METLNWRWFYGKSFPILVIDKIILSYVSKKMNVNPANIRTGTFRSDGTTTHFCKLRYVGRFSKVGQIKLRQLCMFTWLCMFTSTCSYLSWLMLCRIVHDTRLCRLEFSSYCALTPQNLFAIINFFFSWSPLRNNKHSMFPETKPRETLRFERNKIPCSPRDQSLSDLLYSKANGSNRWKTNNHVIDKWRATAVNILRVGRYLVYFFSCLLKKTIDNHYRTKTNNRQPQYEKDITYLPAGNSELLSVWRHSFRNVARSWARFSKAPESFRARKAIFRSSVSKNGEMYTLETSWMKGISLHL